MKAQQHGIFRYIVMLILVIALIRFFPFIIRIIQTAAIAARAFWWLILPVLILSWVARKLIKRKLAAKKSANQLASESYRDVTNSARDRSEKN